MLVPQAMAYALLADVPPVMGLYASTLPLFAYAILGTSKQMAVGPAAMVAILTASGIALANPQSLAEAGVVAATLALLTGAIQLSMGLLRLGFLVNFLSHPVISGFTSAAAVIIATSQIKVLTGMQFERGTSLISEFALLGKHINQINPIATSLSIAAVSFLLLAKHFAPRFPRALAVVAIGTFMSWYFGLAEKGIAIVGNIPQGFPAFSLPYLEADTITLLLPMALTIALVGYMESISVAKSLAAKNHYDIHPGQELVALGGANLLAGLFQAIPVAGGFGRSAVNDTAGARSQFSALISALLVVVTLIWFTDYFYYLPTAILAAIIIVAVLGLVDVKEVRELLSIKQSDFWILLLTFVSTLILGIETGILCGIAASLGWFIVRTTQPHTAVLGRLNDSTTYRNIMNYSGAATTPGLIILRMDAQFYFGNISFLKSQLKTLEQQQAVPLQAVLIDCSTMTNLDSSAARALSQIHHDYSGRNIRLAFSNVIMPVYRVLQATGLSEKVGNNNFFMDTHSAVTDIVTNTIQTSPQS